MSIVVDHLSNHREHVETICAWLHEFWDQYDGYTLDQVIERTQYCLETQSLPQTYIAQINDKPVGTASLWNNDHKFRQDLTPWMAGVFVASEYRDKGIMRELQEFSCKQAIVLGFKDIYAITPLTCLYEKMGWELYSPALTPQSSHSKNIYRKSL
jgi:GNAT superfamily N-acetyltransferase